MYESELDTSDIDIILPVLPLRDIVVFPGMIVPLFVGRENLFRRWSRQFALISKFF